MKITLTLIIFLVVFSLSGSIAFAHTDEVSTTEVLQEGNTLDLMERMSEEMMGRDAHIRMEELMTKLIAGDLSLIEQDEMISIMQDVDMGSGALMMMMQMMGPQMMSDGAVFSSSGMMGGTTNVSYWITMSLMWAVLILGIIALWKWLSKGR